MKSLARPLPARPAGGRGLASRFSVKFQAVLLARRSLGAGRNSIRRKVYPPLEGGLFFSELKEVNNFAIIVL